MTTLYHWVQPGDLNSAESGCSIGIRKGFGEMKNPCRVVGSPATREGGGIRERPVLLAKVVSAVGRMRFGVAAGHAPPARAPKARRRYLRVFSRARAAFKGGDLNVAKRIAARITGRRVIGGGVLWLVLPRKNWKVVNWRLVNVNGDHKAVLVEVKNKRTGLIIRIIVVNCMSVSTGPDRAARILVNAMKKNPDILLASECSDFRAIQVDRISNQ